MAEGQPKLLAALGLMRRSPPSPMEPSLSEELVDLAPTDDLLNTIDQPLTAKDSSKNLLCDYNRDGDSYRRRTNTYERRSTTVSCRRTRCAMERGANDVFQSQREMAYEGGALGLLLGLDDGQNAAPSPRAYYEDGDGAR